MRRGQCQASPRKGNGAVSDHRRQCSPVTGAPRSDRRQQAELRHQHPAAPAPINGRMPKRSSSGAHRNFQVWGNWNGARHRSPSGSGPGSWPGRPGCEEQVERQTRGKPVKMHTSIRRLGVAARRAQNIWGTERTAGRQGNHYRGISIGDASRTDADRQFIAVNTIRYFPCVIGDESNKNAATRKFRRGGHPSRATTSSSRSAANRNTNSISPHDTEGIGKNQARRMAGQREFEDLECPLQPDGQGAGAGHDLNVAKYGGEQHFRDESDWARRFAVMTAAALERPVIRSMSPVSWSAETCPGPSRLPGCISGSLDARPNMAHALRTSAG